MARYALVIGIANYNNFSNLEKAVVDAEAIAQRLERHGNFQEVKRLPRKWLNDENRWAVASDKRLKGKELGDELRTFLLEQAVKNEAVVYFAGHGFPVSSCLGVAEGYLATSDCTEDGRNAILLRHLNALIAQSDLSSLVILLDCCYAGTLLEKQLLQPTLTAFNTKRDYYLITACRGFEKAYEGEDHGYFTRAIIKGLSVENADEKGKVSGDRLFDFIASELKGSGQEPIRLGWGRSITLVQYPHKQTTRVIDETCPYQGLKAFDKDQAQFFFGREKVVQQLIEKLVQANFVPIIGASGSGKSSVVRAGLIPQLEKNGWRVLEPILPGIEPLAELKRALITLFERSNFREIYSLIETEGLRPVIEKLPNEERFLLVIDQFEEVFTVCFKEKERHQFIELLTQVTEIPDSPLAIVTTMRADFLEPCLYYESLTHLIQHKALYMPPLVGAELEEGIATPANLQGYQLETGLLGAILQDVGQEKGCLPLLQFALTELWQQRDRESHKLTLTNYNELGGVIGALNRHAHTLYKDFTEQEQEWVKQIFLKLVRTGVQEKDTRQRQQKAKLLAIAGDNQTHQNTITKVLDKLVDGRLLVTNRDEEDWVDLAHEALMDGWETFAQWRQENRELRRLIDRMEDAYQEWKKHPSDQNLIMGGLLVQVRQKWQYLKLNLDDELVSFYKISIFHEQDRISTVEGLRTESKLREKATKVSNLLPLKPLEGLLLAIGSMGFNLNKLPQQILTPVLSNLSQAMELSRVPILCHGHENFILSVAFSPNGQMIATSGVDKTVRLWDLQGQPIGQPFQGHEAAIHSVAFSPDGQTIVSGGEDKTIRLWNLQGKPIGQPFQGHEDSIHSVAFSPDGQTIVSGGEDKTIRLWNLQGQPIGQPFQGHDSSVYSVAFSPDGNMIASGSWDKTVRLWNLQGQPIGQPFQGHKTSVRSVTFSPDGNIIASGSGDNTVRLWNLQGQPIGQPFQGHENNVMSVAFSPDGQIIASGSWDKTVRLWNLQGQPIGQPFQGHNDSVSSVAFSPDGQMIASTSGSWDKIVYLWDLRSHLIGQSFRGHEGAVNSVAFNPNGQMIVSGGEDKTLRLWDLQGNLISTPFQGHENNVTSVAVSPDGQMIISGSWDGTIRLWDLQGNLMNPPFRGHTDSVWSVAFSPNGQMIVSGSRDWTVRLWDLQGNPISQSLKGHPHSVRSVAVSPDGQIIASGSWDKTIQLWNLQCEPINKGFKFRGHQSSVFCVAFSPNGQTIVSGSRDRTVRLWDVQGNPISQPFQGHEFPVTSVAFHPDGQSIVSGSEDGTVRLWDLQGNPIGKPFQKHEGAVKSVAFSPDGQMIVSGSSDGIICLWRGHWRAWLNVCCDRLRYHPAFQNPQTEVDNQAYETCRQYVWDT
ncbi:MAG: caspase family protein [Coleofasciculus sp. C1-SOL-03]|jgi:WD40 repeat protein|uniref:nSTAND1 domain-containing NTPase n=1 Tax=Coleofasciculus sp. C1-SOL-03 TaxID=3069522 RepID=UPI0032F0D4F0